MEKDCDSKRIECVRVYRPKFTTGGVTGGGNGNGTAAGSSSKTSKMLRSIRLYNVLFLLLYLVQGSWVLSTIGEPYHKFLEKADREGFQVMEGTTRLRAELEHSILRDLNDPNRRTNKIGFFDWVDMDIEELAAEKKRDRERNVLDSLPKNMRVPNKYAASFWPTLLLGILATLHALVLLMQHWSVRFNVWINFMEMDADRVELPPSMLEIDLDHPVTKKTEDDALPPNLPTHARITPTKDGGKDLLVPLEYFPVLGMTFEYHRRRYVFHASHDKDDNGGVWGKIRCRTDLQLQFLNQTQYTGLNSQHQVLTAQIRCGPNVFRVKQPQFFELFKNQLLNPFSVFQVFCVLLWAIDDYLVYSFFSLFMVLVFEASVVFQRLKCMQALRGMGNPTRIVYVLRHSSSSKSSSSSQNTKSLLFAQQAWIPVDTTELLPGDIVSLTRIQPHRGDGKNSNSAQKIQDEGGDIVPADLLLLRGSTVVNEASLTGESVPQMKEGIVLDDPSTTTATDEQLTDTTLDIKNRHKNNVVYAGTKMLQCKGTADYASSSMSQLFPHIPNPPDHGCVCFVLRTGFASAQGKLVRMIEGSQEKVKGHERETGLLLLLLCVFAIISSSYVLYHGMQNDKRSKYELLLHCILIVTSVIRPELPMQMALAVNNSLMTLMRMHVFCTEPYRVPLAGKLDSCLFDKTGTLTTDELVAVGVCGIEKLELKTAVSKKAATRSNKPDDDDGETDFLSPMSKVTGEPAMVLAGCHSLVEVDGVTTGDPLESAALASMRWHVDKDGMSCPAPATEKKPAGKNLSLLLPLLQSASSGGSSSGGVAVSISEIEILTRHHFSSKLQRMSCVIRASGGGGKRHFAVAKGSPEAISRLLQVVPEGYLAKSEYLSKQGYRVIALAYKRFGSDGEVESAKEQRSLCEENLTFAGFIAFTCMVRKDTAQVLRRLREGGMSIAMVTGDALLTAIHVAKEVCIFEQIEETNSEGRALVDVAKLRQNGADKPNATDAAPKLFRPILYLETNDSNALFWTSYEDGSKVAAFLAKEVPQMARRYELATTGKCLARAYEVDSDTKTVLQHFKVFARMTPDAKETVIECLQACDLLTMMTGDGANDVGALKQADVGVALLSGFGNLNVESSDDELKKKEKDSTALTAIVTQREQDELRALSISQLTMKIRSLGVDPSKYPHMKEKEDLVVLYIAQRRTLAAKQHDKKNVTDLLNMTPAERRAEQRREYQKKQAEVQEKVAKRIQELEAQGVSFASFKAMKEVMAEEIKANKQKAAMSSGVEGSAATFAAQLEGMELDAGDLPMVKLGDASVAAPFTSKMPSIRSCVDIVRQGRCTLVSSIQMYQIMALQCLISSYSLSVLYLDGVKYGDTQMTAMGILGTVSFMSVSRSRPLDKLSTVRPLNSIFHPALFLSLLSQFAVHLSTMIIAVQSAKRHLPPDYDADLDGTFKPGLLNTVVFLVSSVQQVTVFVVNLQGRPFMTGLSENRPLLWSLAATFVLTFMFASETVPSMNRYFQLVPFPNESTRDFVLLLLGADLVLTFALDRLMQFMFCRDILRASMEGTTLKDMFGLARTFVVIAVVMQWLLGNSDMWDQLEMQINMTAGNASSEVLESVVEVAADCVGELCNAVKETAANTFAAEF